MYSICMQSHEQISTSGADSPASMALRVTEASSTTFHDKMVILEEEF
jgi:hypothetical protein